jgi:hypothetical protein
MDEFQFVFRKEVCFADLYQGSKMFIFVSIFATFITSVVFRDTWDSSKNWLELNIEPLQENLGLPQSVKHTVDSKFRLA